MKLPFIVVSCGNEKYLFYYSPGNEDELICSMIGYAADSRHSLGYSEVLSVMRHLGLVGAAELPQNPADDCRRTGHALRG